MNDLMMNDSNEIDDETRDKAKGQRTDGIGVTD